MNVVNIEDRSTSPQGVCEECGATAPIRKVEVRASAFGGGGRGWYNICFACFGPRVFWRRNETDSTVYESPA
jgi:hypothetical protein